MQEQGYVYVSAAFILSGCPLTQSNLAFEAVLKENLYKLKCIANFKECI